jgi:antitoxin component YwqK of YwqJK toxin-antitoxin module
VKNLYYSNGKKQEESTMVDGLREGVVKWYNQDEIIVAEYNYSKGEFHGEQKSFYLSGDIRTKETYINGKQTGEFLEYFEDGAVKQKGIFDKNGQKDGDWVEFDQTGKKVKTQKYKAGVLQ